MTRLPLLRTLAALGALLALLAGCSPKKLRVADVPPTVSIFVEIPADTVNHTVNHVIHLYWFGSDPDGQVVGYELRLLGTGRPADTLWTFTTATDEVFTVYAPDSLQGRTFEVRALDDAGLRSAVARQDFTLRNLPPVAVITNKFGPTDSTFASATVSWTVSDPDNDLTRPRFLVWLDGTRATPDTATGTTFTVPSARFLQGGQYLAGYRRLYVQAIDDGGMLGSIDSTRWYVRAPATGGLRHPGRLLIVDNLPSANPANSSTDALYTNAVARAGLGPGNVTILRIESDQPFRSSQDLFQTFQLFDAVVWYAGGYTTFAYVDTTLLGAYQDGAAAYLGQGGRLSVDGLYLVEGRNAPGTFTQGFMQTWLGSDALFNWYQAAPLFDSTASIQNQNGVFDTPFGDSLAVTTMPAVSIPLPSGSKLYNPGGLRAFVVRDPATVIAWARPSALSPAGTFPFSVPVAVAVRQPSGGGRAVLTSFPVRFAGAKAPQYLDGVYQQLLGP